MQNVALVLQMAKHPHSRVDALVVPALSVDAVGAKDLQFATLDFRRQHANHAPVFILEKLSHGGRENQQWHAGMAKDQGLHIAVQFLAVSFVIFAIHLEEEIPLGRCRQCLRCSRSILPDPAGTRTMGLISPELSARDKVAKTFTVDRLANVIGIPTRKYVRKQRDDIPE